MTPAPGSKKKPAGRGGILSLTLATVAIAAIGILFPPTLALIGAGMLPTMVAGLVDRSRHKALTLTVGALNLAGVVPCCIDLTRHDGTLAGAYQMLASPWVWIIMYSGAALGWMIDWILPLVVREVLLFAIDRREAGLHALQKRLREEWGPEIAGD